MENPVGMRMVGRRKQVLFWKGGFNNSVSNYLLPVAFWNLKSRFFKPKHKNHWRRKCVRRAIFRTVNGRVEGSEAPFNLYFVCNTSNCVTVRPVRGHVAPKMNIAFFIRNSILNIFLFHNFFEKNCIFRENRKKLFWGRIWQFSRERRRLTPKINITFYPTT